MKLRGAPWGSMELHEALRSSVELCDPTWSSVDLRGALWRFLVSQWIAAPNSDVLALASLQRAAPVAVTCTRCARDGALASLRL